MTLVIECVSQYPERQRSGHKGGVYWMLERGASRCGCCLASAVKANSGPGFPCLCSKCWSVSRCDLPWQTDFADGIKDFQMERSS